MTDNHLLLYRLAELMFEHEQHLLPVDLLFDDEQIGDFVKSIQIDSPYQQMLIEGVLTEAVRDENLYVSFTVEGYFHYVLGEVIYTRNESLGAEALKQIVEENKMNGAKEGVEQCLILDVQYDNLTRLIWLIDNLNNFTAVCIKPLTFAFLKSGHKSREKEIFSVLKRLFRNYSISDIDTVSETILLLNEYNKIEYLKIICEFIYQFLNPELAQEYSLYIQSLEYITPIKRKKGLIYIQFKLNKNKYLPPNIYYELAYQYELISDYTNALLMYSTALKKAKSDSLLKIRLYRQMAQVSLYADDFRKAIYYANKSNKILFTKSITDNHERGCNLSTLGEAYRQKESYSKAIRYQLKSLEQSIEDYGSFDNITATSYNNLGLVYRSSEKYDLAIHCYEESLRIKENIYNKPNSSIIATLNNLGVVYKYDKRFEDSVEKYNLSLLYSIQVNGINHAMSATIIYNLAIVQKNIGDISSAIKNCRKAYYIFKRLLGTEHSTTKMIKNKISELNDL